MYKLPLVAMALLPAIVLCIYVFKKDKVEKEPIGLLLKLLLFGALSCFPAAIIENILIEVINLAFSQQAALSPELYQATNYLYQFFTNFVGIALVEEGIKFLILVLVTRGNKEFNSLFDGLIYSIFVSLGFAALENVLYVLQYGFEVAVMRAVLSVPGHMFFAVLMGYYYSIWHITEKAILAEIDLKLQQLIPNDSHAFNTKSSIVMCLLMPVLAHGFYDFCCSLGTALGTLLTIAFIAFLYAYCFSKIIKFSKNDKYENDYVRYMIESKYPGVVKKEEATL